MNRREVVVTLLAFGCFADPFLRPAGWTHLSARLVCSRPAREQAKTEPYGIAFEQPAARA